MACSIREKARRADMIIERRTDKKIKPPRGEIKTTAADMGKNNVTPSGLATEFAKIGYNHYIPSGLRASMLCVNLTSRNSREFRIVHNCSKISNSSERWLAPSGKKPEGLT